MTEDLYRTLNLNGKATADDIHRAYRSLALRYHPDRNQNAGSESLMAAINRAYEVLSEPSSRAAYDRTQTPREAGIDEVVIDAARDLLLKKNWVVSQDNREDLVLRNGSRCAHILFTSTLNGDSFDRFHRRSMGFCTALAVRVDPPVSVPPRSAVVLDLMRSRIYGGDFPDPSYRELFKSFIA